MLKQETVEEVRVKLTGKALREMREIADSEGKTLDEVLESAIGLKQWAHEVKENGYKVVVRQGNKDKYQLGL